MSCEQERCITCGDEGMPMRVLELADATAVCADVRGFRHSVAVDLISPVAPGTNVLVHAGVAIALLGGADA